MPMEERARRWQNSTWTELGLYYYRVRHYDPKVGRFLQTDPVPPRPEEMNAYIYVSNNPINATDSYGQKMCTNNSGQDLPYKHDDDAYKEPRTCKNGETCDVDGFYMPDHRVIKVRSYVTYNCEVNKDFEVTGIGAEPFEVTKCDLEKKKKFECWPNPYSGRKWPYPIWP